MNMLFSILLIVLGVFGIKDFVCSKIPSLVKIMEPAEFYMQFVGLFGLIYGFVEFLRLLVLLLHPGQVIFLLELWVATALMLSLSLIFSLDLVRKIIGEPPSKFILKVAQWREGLLVHLKELGFAGIVAGIIFLL